MIQNACGHFLASVARYRQSLLIPTLLIALVAHGTSATYGGGRVVSTAKAYTVFWGSGVNSAFTNPTTGVGPHLSDIVGSRYISWLSEYSTNTQSIAPGTYGGTYTITPSNTSTTIWDKADVQNELAHQIAIGALPAPTDDNSIFIVHFPASMTIHQDGSSGPLNYCTDIDRTWGRHFAFSVGCGLFCSHNVQYAVMPDCGGGVLAQQTHVSHELVETITDPDLNNSPAAWGWTITQNGIFEISDICPQSIDYLVLGPNDTMRGVFAAWSNVQNRCIVAADQNGAKMAYQIVPSTMQGGMPTSVHVSMKNMGPSTWSFSGAFKLGSYNPFNNNTWGVTRRELPAGQSYGPGSTYMFDFNVTPPMINGNYHFQWEMVQESVEWFGTPSTNVDVTVGTMGISVTPSSQSVYVDSAAVYCVVPTVANGYTPGPNAHFQVTAVDGLLTADGESFDTTGSSCSQGLTLTIYSSQTTGTRNLTIHAGYDSPPSTASAAATMQVIRCPLHGCP